MSFELLASLAGLALLDSTSFGTFVIPLVLVVIWRRIPVKPLAVYFGTVIALYFVLGVAISLGLDVAFDALADGLDSRVGSWIQLIAGVGLFLLSFRFDGKKVDTSQHPKWLPKGDDARTMASLGVTAAALEAATMLPYLSAIGLLTASDESFALRTGVLALYCLVMIIPALIVIGMLAVAGERFWSKMERFTAWVQRNSAETVGWVIGIAGFLIARDAAARLWT